MIHDFISRLFPLPLPRLLPPRACPGIFYTDFDISMQMKGRAMFWHVSLELTGCFELDINFQ